MNGTRRDFTKLTLSGLAVLFQGPVFAASARDTTQRGVKLGITTGSLNPLPEVSGKDRLETIVEECVQLGCGNVELAAGFLVPASKVPQLVARCRKKSLRNIGNRASNYVSGGFPLPLWTARGKSARNSAMPESICFLCQTLLPTMLPMRKSMRCFGRCGNCGLNSFKLIKLVYPRGRD